MSIRQWVSGRWNVLGPVCGFVGAVLLAVLGVLWGASAQDPDADPDLIADWNTAIGKLGIEPVFPPDEDVYVGDVLAIVTQDRAEPDKASSSKSLVSPFKGVLKRAVKIDHIDVIEIIKDHYNSLPVFAATSERPANAQETWPRPATSDLPTFELRPPRKALALAAFPGFTIKRSRSGKGSVSLPMIGRLQLSGDQSDSDELQITSTETYGIPTLLAAGVLERYCRDPFTRSACSDKVLRDHLAFMLGDSIKERLPAPRANAYRYGVEIQFVSRVYLTRSIVRRHSNASGREGSQEPPPAPPNPVPGAPATPASVSASAKSLSANDVTLDGAFQRPLAFGYRAVKFNLGDGDAASSNAAVIK